MASRPLLLPGLRPRVPYVCSRCLQKRQHSQEPVSVILRRQNALAQWDRFEREIKEGKRQSIIKTLEQRGLISDVTGDRKALEKLLIKKRAGVYCGVDATAPSLHVGHMLPFITLIWMYLHGYEAISLIGGATSQIGDPTGRTTDRPEMSSTERKANIVAIHYQLKKIWTFAEKLGRQHGYEADKWCRKGLVNNSVWWGNTSFVDVIKYLGKGLRLGEMLAKDTVKKKMESGNGMSFSEFCYPIMQSWDWCELNVQRGVQVQIGGADQYGNITAGVDAVKHYRKNHPHVDVRWENMTELDTPYGITVPLLTTASGQKFGKSAGNAVWLDAQMTSPFDLYGYFVGTADTDVERFLKMFTFRPLTEIGQLMKQHRDTPTKRIPHHALAYSFVALAHGTEVAEKMQQQHESLFANRQGTNLTSLLSQEGQTGTDAAGKSIDFSAATPAAELPAVPKNPLHDHPLDRFRERADHISNNSNKYAPQTTAENAPPSHTVLPECLIRDTTISKVLWSAGLVKSRSEGHRLGAAQGAYIGRRKGQDHAMSDKVEFEPAKLHHPDQMWSNIIPHSGPPDSFFGDGLLGLLVLRVGKWRVRICRVVTDAKYTELLAAGKVAEAPGWSEFRSALAAARAESKHGIEKLERYEAEAAAARAASTVEEVTDTSLGREAPDKEEGDAAWDAERPLHRTERDQAYTEQQQAGHREFIRLEAEEGAAKEDESPAIDRQEMQALKGESLEAKEEASEEATEVVEAKPLVDPASEYGPDKRKWPSDVIENPRTPLGPRTIKTPPPPPPPPSVSDNEDDSAPPQQSYKGFMKGLQPTRMMREGREAIRAKAAKRPSPAAGLWDPKSTNSTKPLAYRAFVEKYRAEERARLAREESSAGRALRETTRSMVRKKFEEQKRAQEREWNENKVRRNRKKIEQRAVRRDERREADWNLARGIDPRKGEATKTGSDEE